MSDAGNFRLGRRVGLIAALAALALVAVAVASATPGEAGRSGKKVAIYDMFGQKKVKPETIFLTANSGPYIDEIVWSGWRSGNAVGEGVYISDCASCPPPERREATVTLSRLKPCAKKGGRAYKRGKLETGADYSNEPRSSELDTGFIYCKRRR